MLESLPPEQQAVFERLERDLREAGVEDDEWLVRAPDLIQMGPQGREFREGGLRILCPREPDDRWELVRSDRHGDYPVGTFDSAAEIADGAWGALVGTSRPAAPRRSKPAKALRWPLGIIAWLAICVASIMGFGWLRQWATSRSCRDWGDPRGYEFVDVTTGVPASRPSSEGLPGTCEFLDANGQTVLETFDVVPSGIVHDVVDGGAVIAGFGVVVLSAVVLFLWARDD